MTVSKSVSLAGLGVDDDGSAGGQSMGSSISGTSLVGTGQGAPSYYEVTANLCRAVYVDGGGVQFLCAKRDTCGTTGHAVARATESRGQVGFYKVANVKKKDGSPTRVFAL